MIIGIDARVKGLRMVLNLPFAYPVLGEEEKQILRLPLRGAQGSAQDDNSYFSVSGPLMRAPACWMRGPVRGKSLRCG